MSNNLTRHEFNKLENVLKKNSAFKTIRTISAVLECSQTSTQELLKYLKLIFLEFLLLIVLFLCFIMFQHPNSRYKLIKIAHESKNKWK